MEPKKIVSLICRIIGRDKVNRRQREELTSLIGLITNNKQEKPQVVVTPKVVEDPNTMNKEEPNTIDLGLVNAFDIPKDINLEFEGQEGLRKIKIFPDGISETPVASA